MSGTVLVAGYNCEQEMFASGCHGADTGEQERPTARKKAVTKCKNNEGNWEAAEIENNGGREPLPIGRSGKETSSFPVAEAVNYAMFPPAQHPFPSLYTTAFSVPSATWAPGGDM